MTEKEYQRRVNELLPRSKTGLMCLKAFAVGGGICCLGQLISDLGRMWLDLDREQAGALCSLSLIFLAGLLTALGVFDRIAAFAGAGTVVPITGFANSIVAPAMEFRSEMSSPRQQMSPPTRNDFRHMSPVFDRGSSSLTRC